MSIRVIYLLLVITGFTLYIVSLFSPILLVKEFYVFSDTITILSVLSILMHDGELFLFIIIFIFAIILPSVKYLLLLAYGAYPESLNPSSNMLVVLEAMSKWAMLDVFIVAILVASIKLKVFSAAETQYGLYVFVCAVIISIVCTQVKKYWQQKNVVI